MTADRFTKRSVGPAVPAESRWGRNPGLFVVFLGALFLGAGSLGSAATGALPGPMQHAAHSVLEKIGVSVPSGKASQGSERSPSERSAERFLVDAGTPCTYPDGSQFSGTHGQYVAVHPDDPATADDERASAARSRCGRPVAGGGSQPPAEPGKPDDPGNRVEAGRPEGVGQPKDVRPQNAGQPRNSVKPATGPASSDRAVQPGRQQLPAPAPRASGTTVAPSPPAPPAEPVAEEPAPPGRRAGREGSREAPAPKAGGGEEKTGSNARTSERGNRPGA